MPNTIERIFALRAERVELRRELHVTLGCDCGVCADAWDSWDVERQEAALAVADRLGRLLAVVDSDLDRAVDAALGIGHREAA
jgi:hypothetical protein